MYRRMPKPIFNRTSLSEPWGQLTWRWLAWIIWYKYGSKIVKIHIWLYIYIYIYTYMIWHIRIISSHIAIWPMDPCRYCKPPWIPGRRSAAFGAAVGKGESSFPGALDLWALREWPGGSSWKWLEMAGSEAIMIIMIIMDLKWIDKWCKVSDFWYCRLIFSIEILVSKSFHPWFRQESYIFGLGLDRCQKSPDSKSLGHRKVLQIWVPAACKNTMKSTRTATTASHVAKGGFP